MALKGLLRVSCIEPLRSAPTDVWAGARRRAGESRTAEREPLADHDVYPLV